MAANHDVFSLFIYDISAASLPNMLFIVVRVKRSKFSKDDTKAMFL
jgi:hypothetical protein